jgi:hypothetical protein
MVARRPPATVTLAGAARRPDWVMMKLKAIIATKKELQQKKAFFVAYFIRNVG